MTRRALDKPRGYAGDAVLFDYLYRLRPDDFVDVAPSRVLVWLLLYCAEADIWALLDGVAPLAGACT